jgi:hypothetical protein
VGKLFTDFKAASGQTVAIDHQLNQVLTTIMRPGCKVLDELALREANVSIGLQGELFHFEHFG